MEGIEKITAQILLNAGRECDESLAKAKEEVTRIKQTNNQKAAQIIRMAREDAERERETIISRGESGAAMMRRNTLLEAKGRMVEEAYEKSVGYLCRMDEPVYYSMLSQMLTRAVTEALAADEILKADDESGYVVPDHFTLSLNAKDAKKYGERLIADLQKAMPGVSVVLSQAPAQISGGLMIRYGDMYIDCSAEESVRSVRAATERRVCSVLFGNH